LGLTYSNPSDYSKEFSILRNMRSGLEILDFL
jgi:hypothetical protein